MKIISYVGLRLQRQRKKEKWKQRGKSVLAFILTMAAAAVFWAFLIGVYDMAPHQPSLAEEVAFQQEFDRRHAANIQQEAYHESSHGKH